MGAGDLADLLACVTAFARSLEGKFDPQRFLDEFSERSQPLVPHDGTVIAWLEDEGRSFSAFAGGRVIGAFLMAVAPPLWDSAARGCIR